MKWWHNEKVSVVWTMFRIWLGIKWIDAGLHKVNDGFDASGFLQGAAAKAAGEHPVVQGWYAAFLNGFAVPNVELFNILIPWGEVPIGLGLITGLMTVPALLAGAFMNLKFLMAGTVSTNPILLTVAVILLFTGRGAYYRGADQWVMPYLRQHLLHKDDNKKGIIV
jgi:thiosulfate dehydrogenase (quinone) large subunit